jgi:hypothetical protein
VKVVYVQSPIYDYSTASLIEGLTALGHRVLCSESSNYGGKLPDAELIQEAETADIIFCGSNVGVRSSLLRAVQNSRVCFVDGADHQAFGVPFDLRFKAIFKRELCGAVSDPAARQIYPLPFAAESRYFTVPRRKDILVSFLANMSTNPLRGSVHQRLLNLRHPAVISGSTNERAYLPGHARGGPIETPRYRELLARSLISINVAGAGYDCARHWEIPAAGAMLFTQALDIVIPEPFVDGTSCVTFASLAEFDEKLAFYVARPDVCAAIAARGLEQLRRWHTSKARAEYAMAIALNAANADGYCKEFLDPELRALEAICVGRGIDVGCGDLKTTARSLGVDVVAKGQTNEAGHTSIAEISAPSHNLAMFENASLDFVVSRGELSRCPDPAASLREWCRVLRIGGRLGVAVARGATPGSDARSRPNWYTEESLRSLLGGSMPLRIIEMMDGRPGASLIAICERCSP